MIGSILGVLDKVFGILPSIFSWIKSALSERKAAKLAVLEYREEQRKLEMDLEYDLIKAGRNKKKMENDIHRRD